MESIGEEEGKEDKEVIKFHGASEESVALEEGEEAPRNN